VRQQGQDLLARPAGEPLKEIVHTGAYSNFSSKAFTGTRVPLNNQAPLTRSCVRSTAGQEFQSRIAGDYGQSAIFTKISKLPLRGG